MEISSIETDKKLKILIDNFKGFYIKLEYSEPNENGWITILVGGIVDEIRFPDYIKRNLDYWKDKAWVTFKIKSIHIDDYPTFTAW